jgi:hypothetical protein
MKKELRETAIEAIKTKDFAILKAIKILASRVTM